MFVNKVSLNYYQNYQTPISKSQNVAFTGSDNVDGYVQQIKDGKFPDKDDLLSAMHGRMNYRSDAVESVVPVLLESAEKSAKEIRDLNIQLGQVNQDLEAEKQKVKNVEAKMAEDSRIYTSRLSAKDKTLAEMSAKLAEQEKRLKKYEYMYPVKSINELDTVLPEEAIQVLNDMIEHRSNAASSLVEYLRDGKGAVEFINQLNRFTKVLKAKDEGVWDDPQVQKVIREAEKKQTLISEQNQVYFIRKMIENALKTCENPSFLYNATAREQVKKNALSLLALVSEDNNLSNLGLKASGEILDKKLKEIADFWLKIDTAKDQIYQEIASNNHVYSFVLVPGVPAESGIRETDPRNPGFQEFISLSIMEDKPNSNWH